MIILKNLKQNKRKEEEEAIGDRKKKKRMRQEEIEGTVETEVMKKNRKRKIKDLKEEIDRQTEKMNQEEVTVLEEMKNITSKKEIV